MTTARRGEVLKGFRTLFEAGAISGLSDSELLDRSADREAATAELAFAALVERHGPMVLRVCRKALGDPHDAHDAFQSTFLVLARKADSIRDRRSVASWLHGVALRVSSARRAAEARRRKHERRRAEGAAVAVAPEAPDDLGAVLHEEVGRLPERYRAAVVLCYLEGRTCEEAAGHLKLPVGTIKSRLSWARDRLRDRLQRRGFGPAAGAVATMLAAESAQAAVALPASWVEATAAEAHRFAAGALGTVPGASAALAQGVIDAMRMHKIKLAAASLAGLIVSGAALMAQQPAEPLRGRETDRLKAVEEKLDRLISVMEKQAERSLPPPAQGPPQAEPNLMPPKVQQPPGPIAAPAPPAAPALAADVAPLPVPAPPAVGAPPIAPRAAAIPNTRLDAIERRLDAMEKRLDALERRTSRNVPEGGAPPAAAVSDVLDPLGIPAREPGSIRSLPPAESVAPSPAPTSVPQPSSPFGSL